MRIYEALLRHAQSERASFHMPGHKAGKAFLGTPFSSPVFSFDTTELPGTDCLFSPEDFLLEAQERAARAYGAERAFYLVNGATCGVLAMFSACFSEGDTVLVDRNCHRSAVNALALCGAEPVYLRPEISAESGLPGRVEPETVRNAFLGHPKAKGVFITSPNYYGVASDLAAIAEIAHAHGALLLVDEAHGAHFPFSPRFPFPAVRQGADFAVVSLHKSLPALNQSALLLVGSGCAETGGQAAPILPETGRRGAFASGEAAVRAVSMFQTTSPSYLLMCLMDEAVRFGMEKGAERTEQILAMAKGIPSRKTDDPFKRILPFPDGRAAERILRERHGIYAELADRRNVLLMLSWANDEADFSLLEAALAEMASDPATRICRAETDGADFPAGEAARPPFPQKSGNPEIPQTTVCGVCADAGETIGESAESGREAPPLPFFGGAMELSPREVSQIRMQSGAELVPFSEAEGRISAESVTPFPPCVPVLLPGERVRREHIAYLSECLSRGDTVGGITNGKFSVLCR